MRSCEDYSDLLLDALYGLLEPDDDRGLRTHVSGCERCRLALAEAQKHQTLFARAAQMYQHLAPFDAPADNNEPALPDTQAPAATATVPSAPQTIPLPERRRRRLRWAMVAAAAAVLVAAIGASFWYNNRVDGYHGQTAEARRQIENLDSQIKLVQMNLLKKAAALPAQVTPPTHIQVLGPASYHADASSPFRIATRDVFGKPQATPLVVRWKGDDVHEFRFDSTGEQFVSLPAGLLSKSGRATLEVEARPGTDPVRESIKIEEPAYVTHIAMSKSAYRIGEVLFFRTLTLQRFSLKPPTEKIPLVYALVDAHGKTRRQHLGLINDGGIGGGEFALTKDLPDGEYTLEVSEYVFKDKAKTQAARVLPQRQRVAIHRGAGPVRIDAGVANATALVGQKLSGMVGLSLAIAPRLTVDFYPEGGDLVAGLPTRVYYRVRSSLGDTVAPQGRVILISTKDVLLDSPPGQAMGVFTFTPEAGETYTLRMTWPKRSGEGVHFVETTNPFGDLIHSRGVALAVPRAVGREGHPLETELRNTGPETRVLLLAACRGRVVDQRFVDVPAGTTSKNGAVTPGQVNVTLSPVKGATGIVRLTAYEVQGGALVPLAERLVYRAPVEELILSARTDKTTYQPGDAVQLKVDGRDEKGASMPGWVLGVVVAQNLSPQQAGLPAHFLLSDMRPDLENADLLVHEGPSLASIASLFPGSGPIVQALEAAHRQQMAHGLDLYLGTHGWRRFVQHAPPMFVQGGPKKTETAETPILLSSENANPTVLAKRYEAALAKALDDLRRPLEQEFARLDGERGNHVRQARLSALALIDFQEQSRAMLRMGIAGVVLTLLGIGGLLLLMGVVRMARRQASPRMALASAAGVVLSALILYGVTMRGLGLNEAHAADDALAWLNNTPRLQAADLQVPKVRPSAPPGLLFARATPRTDLRPASRHVLAQADPSADPFVSPDRFAEAQKEDQRAQAAIKKVSPFAGAASGPKQIAMLKDAATHARVYANTGTPRTADTLLWAPSALLKDGTTTFDFRLPQNPTTYQILLYANTPSGRLGFYRGTLHTSETPKQ